MVRVDDASVTHGPIDRQVARLAARQYGVFARDQVKDLGATRGGIDHRVRVGRWEPLERSVFRLAGSPESWRQSLMTACLAWGPGATISHSAAAALWRLAGFEPGSVELTVPRDRRGRGPGVVHRSRLEDIDRAATASIPVTTPARTLLDIASVASEGVLEEALDDALRRGMVSIPRLRWRLDELGRRPGAAVVRSLLDSRYATSVPQSVLETRLERILRRAGLPELVRQHPIRSAGRLVAVVDFALAEARLAIEADGYRWHSGRTRWEHDRARRNELTLLGWRVIHVRWTDPTRRPGTVIDTIRNAMAREV